MVLPIVDGALAADPRFIGKSMAQSVKRRKN